MAENKGYLPRDEWEKIKKAEEKRKDEKYRQNVMIGQAMNIASNLLIAQCKTTNNWGLDRFKEELNKYSKEIYEEMQRTRTNILGE